MSRKKIAVLITALVLSVAVTATVSTLAWFVSEHAGTAGTVVVGKFSANVTLGESASGTVTVPLASSTVLGDDASFSENAVLLPVSVVNDGDVAFRLAMQLSGTGAGDYLAYMLADTDGAAAADLAGYLIGLLYAEGEAWSDAETHARIARHNAAFLSEKTLAPGAQTGFTLVLWACGMKVKEQDPFAGGVHLSGTFRLTVGIVQAEGGA